MGMRAYTSGTVTDLHQEMNRTTRASRRQIEREARRLEELSRRYTPVDSGDLEASHQVTRFVENSQRVAYAVEFGDNVSHAIKVHENLTGQAFGTGKKSQLKAARLGLQAGVDIGPHFLTRAFDDLEESMQKNMEEAARKS